MFSTPSPIRTPWPRGPLAAGAAVFAFVLVALGTQVEDDYPVRDGALPVAPATALAGAPDLPVDPHPEWVLPYAASTETPEAPAVAVAVAPAPARAPREVVPSWLTGQSDLSPAAVVETWRAYARTQGPSLDAMRELVAYAMRHPARTADARGQSVDAWLRAVAADPSVLQQMVAAGYLDDRMSALFQTSDARVVANAVRDLDWASGCAGQACGSWRARYAEALLRERDERDPATSCGIARLATIGGWVVGEEPAAARDIARALDTYLANQRDVACGPMG